MRNNDKGVASKLMRNNDKEVVIKLMRDDNKRRKQTDAQ